MNQICIMKEKCGYPNKKTLFRPSFKYPEYIFGEDISKTENKVYDMIRKGLKELGLDEENYNTKDWNPFRSLVTPGDNVLIKPNMVLHYNGSNCGTDCLFTHPSLVAAVIDFVCIALEGKGKIIIGDAPLQECEFDVLVKNSGYDVLVEYYKTKGIDIELVDFRNVKTYEKDGLHYLQNEEKTNGIVVQLNEKSAFADISNERMEKLRITNYDPRILRKHHQDNLHEYNVSEYVLNADVIINMPKPKTHRKAGVTISLKNLIGINANKEFLPHHTLGSKAEGGDAYANSNNYLKRANEVLDIKNELVHDEEMEMAGYAEKLYEALWQKGIENSGERFWEGSWYGNDTIWRTIMDLNRILLYANKEGKMTGEIQRKLFIVGDMVVSGEKEGPLEPTPTYPGVIVMGDAPLQFDRVVCSLMGFDYHDIPTLFNEEISSMEFSISKTNEVNIVSNDERWNKSSMEEIRENYSLEFQPTMGWLDKLGNRYRDRVYQTLQKRNQAVYVFGAGVNGVYAASELTKQGIKVRAFCDNNENIWGKEIMPGISCISPEEAEIDSLFVIGMRDEHIEKITEQILKMGSSIAGVINRGC